MLTVRKSITFNGESKIDGIVAEQYQATLNTENPRDMSMSSWQTDQQLYKKNREQCRADSAEFEDMAYEEQDRMIAEREQEQADTPDSDEGNTEVQ